MNLSILDIIAACLPSTIFTCTVQLADNLIVLGSLGKEAASIKTGFIIGKFLHNRPCFWMKCECLKRFVERKAVGIATTAITNTGREFVLWCLDASLNRILGVLQFFIAEDVLRWIYPVKSKRYRCLGVMCSSFQEEVCALRHEVLALRKATLIVKPKNM